MTTQEAVCERIRQIMRQKNITINGLAERAGIHHSTLDTMLAVPSSTKNTGITTIKKICQGLDIQFSVFWAYPLFDEENLEYEE